MWYSSQSSNTLRVYSTIILNASYNGTNFDIILKIVCWCVPCFPQKCSSLLLFSGCWLLTAAVRLCVWYQVHRSKVWLVMCAQCKLSLCVHTANFSHTQTQARTYSQFSLRYANHFDGTFVFFANSNFFPQFEPSLLKLNSESHAVANFWTFFFFLFLPHACSMIFSRNLRNLVFVKVHPSLYAYTQNTHAEIFNSHGIGE